jgi:hypothetical protein
MYPLQGRAWLEIGPDGTAAAEISLSPGGELWRWPGQMQVTGEIELEQLPGGPAVSSAHSEGEILPSGLLRVKLLIGGLRPVPPDAELELARRRPREGTEKNPVPRWCQVFTGRRSRPHGRPDPGDARSLY